MKLKTFLFDDESGVSPVIGVILMVAITVILAAVIATFVLGLGEQISDTAPSASFSYEYDGADELTIIHNGGSSVEGSTLSVTVDGTSVADSGTYDYDSSGWPTDVSASDSVTITGIDSEDLSVQVIWDSPDGDQSAILSEW